MCYNATVSLETFLLGMMAIGVVVTLNEYKCSLVLIVFSVTSMQLLEYFVWLQIDNGSTFWLSLIASVILFSQVALINWFYLQGLERCVCFVILGVLTGYCYYYCFTNGLFFMDKGANGHLRWHFLQLHPVLIIFMLLFYMYPLWRTAQYAMLCVAVVMLDVSLYFHYKYGTWGSMWCYFSNVLWIFMVGNSLYLKFRKRYVSSVETAV